MLGCAFLNGVLSLKSEQLLGTLRVGAEHDSSQRLLLKDLPDRVSLGHSTGYYVDPAHKTQMLVRNANQMAIDFIDELRNDRQVVTGCCILDYK